MSWSSLSSAAKCALLVGLVFGIGTIARADEDGQPAGKVVQIGHSDKADARPNLPPPGQGDEDDQARPATPKFWIGLYFGEIPADNPLRAQLDIPGNEGLLVAEVIPKSPAAKAGMKQHDILLKGNGKDLSSKRDLVDLVTAEGPKKGQITLDVLRHGKHETVNLKPEDRPADADMQAAESGAGGFGFGQSGPMAVDPNSGRPGMPRPNGPMQFNFRTFGPGVIVGSDPFAGLPNGVSINIQKENDKPTHITVQRGSDKWEITGDDAEALKKLPADLRPAVERMLHGGGGGFGGAMGGAGNFRMPDFPQGPGMGPGFDGNQMREQLERMEKRLNELQQRMHGPENQPADKPNGEQEESK
jgi:hypothetical protein